MSEDSLHFDTHVLRRTLSTGDIPSRELPRPPRARISAGGHYPRYPNEHPPDPLNPPDPPTELPSIVETQPYRSWYGRTMAFFGYGRRASKARRELVSLIWNLCWGFVQVVVIIVLLTLSTHKESRSPLTAGRDEWHACDRPLGVWNCIWIVRIFLACGLSYWGWCRDRKIRANQADQESGGGTNLTSSRNAQPRPSTPRSPRSPSSPRSRAVQSAINPPDPAEAPSANSLPYSRLYARLSLLSSLMTLSWFLTANILAYTSINTCRTSSPHLWWLTFGILCIMYLMVLEVFLLGFVVFIMAPLLFLCWNIILLCLGRHPMQNPHMIKPEIGKLPKSIVDRIPLVVYIPPPPDEPASGMPKIPEAIYSTNTYPPKPKPSNSSQKKRFAFLKKFKGKKAGKDGDKGGNGKGEKQTGQGNGEPQTWEEHWEQGEYPFVRLEGNRAACAICLMDFEEPKRIAGSPTDAKEEEGAEDKPVAHDQSVAEGPVQEIQVDTIQEEDRNTELKLEDAGEGAQPLRLLACGHVFHKTCLDPWLVDVSGRCPVCQRPVEIPEPESKKKRRRQRSSPSQ